ncbi:MAG: LPS assembly lipoprotein LptE [Bacteroidota bacterium]
MLLRQSSLLLLLLFSLTTCYSFKGISIPEGVEKAYVPNFTDNAIGAPPTLYLDLTERLRDKVRDEARLIITEDAPDIELKGTLVDFRVTAEAARAGNETAAFSALNRLTVVVLIEYKNLLDPEDEGWRQNFSHFFDFPGSQTLASVQEEALEEIFDNINEKIFNKAFAEDW